MLESQSVSPISGLNEELDTKYLDVAPDDDSKLSRLTRFIADEVGKVLKPRQILIVLRLLKAVTFCFLILTVCADIMYIIFVNYVAVQEQLGGFRDTTIRLYGVALAILAILVELDVATAVKHFSGLKSFVARGLLLLLVAIIASSRPIKDASDNSSNAYTQYDDDQQQGDADGDDYNYVMDDDYSSAQPMPNSAIAFQMVTSWILAGCALAYIILGCLCLDRFTSRAFLSQKDPLTSTAIPEPSGVKTSAVPGVFRSSYAPPGSPQEQI